MTSSDRRPNGADVELDPHDAGQFRKVMGRIPTSVAVIASISEEQPVGVSVGSFASVSLAPPLVGFFIAESSSTWPRIARTGGFCASILHAEQEHISRQFAASGADRFSSCGWAPSRSGRPVIEGSIAWIDCDLHSTAPAGDHQLVLGAVRSMGHSDAPDPLIFLGGGYGRSVMYERGAEGWA